MTHETITTTNWVQFWYPHMNSFVVIDRGFNYDDRLLFVKNSGRDSYQSYTIPVNDIIVDGCQARFTHPVDGNEVTLKHFMSEFFNMKYNRYDELLFTVGSFDSKQKTHFNEMYDMLITELGGEIETKYHEPYFHVRIYDEDVYIHTCGDYDIVPLCYIKNFDELYQLVRVEEEMAGAGHKCSDGLLSSKKYVVDYVNSLGIKFADIESFNVRTYDPGYSPIEHAFSPRGCWVQAIVDEDPEENWAPGHFITFNELDCSIESIGGLILNYVQMDGWEWDGPDQFDNITDVIEYIHSNLKVLEW